MSRPSVSIAMNSISPNNPNVKKTLQSQLGLNPTHLQNQNQMSSALNSNGNRNSSGNSDSIYNTYTRTGLNNSRLHCQLKLENEEKEEDLDEKTEVELEELTPLAPLTRLQLQPQSQTSPNGEAAHAGDDKLIAAEDGMGGDEIDDDDVGVNVNDDDLYSYGWSSFRPKSLQFMSNRKAFLVVFCLTCILQGTFHTYFVAVITTLEKLFSIPSRTTGILMSATEVGQVSSSLLLPYYVSSRHRPHWISYGSVLFSIATLLTITPHLLYPPRLPKAASVSDNLCIKPPSNSSSLYPQDHQDSFFTTSSSLFFNDSSFNGELRGNMSLSSGTMMTSDHDTLCGADERDPPPTFLFGILFLCLLCIGLGQTAVYTLGIPYLDDNVASRDSPLYFSITIGVRILGPGPD